MIGLIDSFIFKYITPLHEYQGNFLQNLRLAFYCLLFRLFQVDPAESLFCYLERDILFFTGGKAADDGSDISRR